MNEEIELKIIELMDDGATPENSSELRDLIDSSKETKSFYESILISEKKSSLRADGDNLESKNKVFV